MEMQVDQKLCAGCGDCLAVCPVDAIHLESGHAEIDQSICRQCQACVEACPQGAITAVEIPVLATQPVSIQPANQVKVIMAEPVVSDQKPWLAAALAFAGREIFPRLADALVNTLERRLAQKSTLQSPTRVLESPPARNDGQGQRRQRRSGYGGRRRGGRGQGRGIGKGKWF